MKVNITIKGAIHRPSYAGHVELTDITGPISKGEIINLVVSKLNRTSYQVDRLRPSDITIHSVEF